MLDNKTRQKFEKLLAWWQSFQEERGSLPDNSHFAPTDLPDLTSGMFMMERDVCGSFEITYWGDNLRDVSGELPLGRDYLERFRGEDAERIGQYLTFITGRPCGGLINRSVFLTNGRCLRTWNMGLPFGSADGLVRHVGGYVEIQSVERTMQVGISLRQEEQYVAYLDLGHGTPEGAERIVI